RRTIRRTPCLPGLAPRPRCGLALPGQSDRRPPRRARKVLQLIRGGALTPESHNHVLHSSLEDATGARRCTILVLTDWCRVSGAGVNYGPLSADKISHGPPRRELNGELSHIPNSHNMKPQTLERDRTIHQPMAIQLIRANALATCDGADASATRNTKDARSEL